jgi:rod shape-determining protein MreD
MTFRKAMDGYLGPALFGLVAFLLRVSLFGRLPIDGVTPDLMLVVVVMTALRQGAYRGMILGLVAGLVEDIATGRLIGMHALGLMFAGLAAGFLRRRLYPDPWFIPMIAVLLGIVLQELVVVTTFFVLHIAVQQLPILVGIEYIYTVPFAYIIRPVFHRPEAPA